MVQFPSRSPARPDVARITTPAGSTIEPAGDGRYRVCDRRHHCRQARNLWEAQQLVQWAEVHHQSLDSAATPS